MNCEWTRANVALYVYDELKDDERYELERHVERCSTCQSELEATRGFRLAMSASPVPDPSPNLLTSSRMRLSEALESEQPHRGWHRFTFDLAGWLQSMKFAPALTAALLMVGFAAGVLTTWQVAQKPAQVAEIQKGGMPPVDSAAIASIRSGKDSVRQSPSRSGTRINQRPENPTASPLRRAQQHELRSSLRLCRFAGEEPG